MYILSFEQGEFIVDKLWSGNLETDFLKYLPIPNGDYALFTTIFYYNIEMFTVQFYLKKSD